MDLNTFYRSGRFGAVCLGLILISGCSDIRRTFGIENKPSDEFMVSPAQKELEVPPDFNLLPPQSPADAASARATQEITAQEEDGTLKKKSLTASEKEVLKQLGPGLSTSDRARMDEKALQEEASFKKKGPLGRSAKSKLPKGESLDPKEEQKKLQSLKN